MAESIQAIRDKILDAALPLVSADGWSWGQIQTAAQAAGYQDNMADAVFPDGLTDAVAHFSDKIDRLMLQRLEALDPDTLRVRDRVREATLARFAALEDYKPVMRSALAYWSAPMRVLQGQRVLWRTADRIWDWAGDTATDYNRQTKRALLCSILLGSSMVWIEDNSPDHQITAQFVERRIENVMAIGKTIGTIGSVVPHLKRQTS